MERKKIAKLVAAILITNAAGLLGSVFTTPNIGGWYASIQKSAFTPPNWVFAPAWTTLFVLMGISLFLVWEKDLKKNKIAVGIFVVQMTLNVLWSVLFFGMQNPFLAFVEIIALWIAILATIVLFYRVDRRAAWLLVPYIVWVSFAAFLNYSVWILN